MMNKAHKEIYTAFDKFRDEFEVYYSVLCASVAFDPNEPIDFLTPLGSFAGFCDRIDEAKYILFDQFQAYASEYFHYFKEASSEEQAAQRTENSALRADDDLINYVASAESEEEFWGSLISGSANVAYLWGTSAPDGKNHFYRQMNEMRSLIRSWEERNAELQKRLEQTAES